MQDETLGIVGSPRRLPRASSCLRGSRHPPRGGVRKAYPILGAGLPQFRYEDRCPHLRWWARLQGRYGGGVLMRAKLSSWKHLLFTAAVLATLALAAGAKYRPH